MTVPPLAPADHLLLERVLRETGVATVPSRPGLADYMLVIARAVAERLGHAMGPLGDLLRPHAPLLLLATKVFVLTVLGILLLVLIRWIRRRRALPRHEPGSTATAVSGSDREDPGLETWASEMERHLEGGDVRGALEALWWWLARSLCGPRADPSWTSRELLDRARRPDLRAFAAAFDRLAYGREAPRATDVRELMSRLRSVLA